MKLVMNNYHLRSFVFVCLSSVVFSDLFANGLPVSSTDCQNGTVLSGGCIIDTTSQGLYGSNYTLFGDISSGSSVGITIDAINGTTTTYSGDILTTGTSAAGVYIRFGNTNSFTLNGNIDTSGAGAYGLYLLDSDNNTLTVNGNITTTGLYATSIYNGYASEGNNYLINGLVQMNDPNSNSAYALYNIGGIDNLTIASSAALKATANDTLAYGIRNVDGAIIASLTNAGSIQAVAANSKAYAISNYKSLGARSIIGTLTNSGSIVATAGSTARAISNRTSLIESLINTGNISATVTGSTAVAISNHDGDIAILNNSGIISVSAFDNAIGIDNYGDAGGNIATLINSGTITATATDDDYAFGVYNGATSIINSFTNTGTIVTSSPGINVADVYNLGSMTTFNNQQTGLTYSGTLPDNYTTIIDDSGYGQLFVSNEAQAAAGATVYQPFAGAAGIGVKIKTNTYNNVITGVSSANLNATRSGTLTGDGTSSAGSTAWTLTETASGSKAWNLNTTGNYFYFGSVAALQSSLNKTASAIRGAFNSITTSMNFANMTTYDCNLFGSDGGCVSVGGRYTGTDNPDTTATAVVAKAGYKFNEHFRYGAFVDQTANAKTSNVDLDMHTPMVGFMGVWNQNSDQLGMQVKLANTYQQTDATITRNGLGNGDDYRGDTDIDAQSYVAELSWRHLNTQKDTLLQPFVATRYAIIDQDGYSDGFVNYGSVEQKTLTALVGVKAFYQYSHKMTYMGSLGVEHDLDEETDDLSVSVAGVSGLTAADMDGGEDKTRILGSVGARFFVTPNQRLEGKLMYEQLRYNNADSTTAYVNYTIGF